MVKRRKQYHQDLKKNKIIYITKEKKKKEKKEKKRKKKKSIKIIKQK